jgi:hypothetical protein
VIRAGSLILAAEGSRERDDVCGEGETIDLDFAQIRERSRNVGRVGEKNSKIVVTPAILRGQFVKELEVPWSMSPQ